MVAPGAGPAGGLRARAPQLALAAAALTALALLVSNGPGGLLVCSPSPRDTEQLLLRSVPTPSECPVRVVERVVERAVAAPGGGPEADALRAELADAKAQLARVTGELDAAKARLAAWPSPCAAATPAPASPSRNCRCSGGTRRGAPSPSPTGTSPARPRSSVACWRSTAPPRPVVSVSSVSNTALQVAR